MSSGREYRRGDVVWSTDPFKLSSDVERPWLLLSRDTHPRYPRQYIAVAVTTNPDLESHPLHDDYWEAGGTPKQSWIEPWAIHSPRREDLAPPENYPEITDAWQGRLKESFVDQVVDELAEYIR